MIMRKQLLLILFMYFGLAACSGQFSADNPEIITADSPNIQLQNLTQKIDILTTKIMEEEHIPGAAIVIVKDGQTLLKRGYGMANLDENRAVDPDNTLFRIGSVSKALTSIALVRLADEGRIDLNDNVSQYVPAFDSVPNYSASTAPVKIRHLITHTGGFDQIGIGRHIWELEKSVEERKNLRPDLETYLFDGNLRRTSPPGVHYRYDTYGITLAGLVLEKVTNENYAEAMKSTLFEPLGMSKSYVEAKSDVFADLAKGYGYVNGKYGIAPYEVYVTTPASSIDATPADMGRLLESLTKAKDLFPRQFHPHSNFPGVTNGLMEQLMADDEGRHPIRSVGHGGSMLGYRSSFEIVPELQLGFFVITNRNAEAGGGRVSLHRKIRDLILDEFHTPETPQLYIIPEADSDNDLSSYEGNYHYGVFCRTCTPEELKLGGWQKGQPVEVSSESGELFINDDRYYMSKVEEGVFTRHDGRKKVFFGKALNGRISFFSYSSSPDTFERSD